MHDFYTYIYYDPVRNYEPIYVGKGCGNRAWSHLSSKKKHPFIQRIQYILKNGKKPIIGFYSGLDEELAMLVEEEIISKIGRKDLGKGPLLNLSDGGEGAAGSVRSDTFKKNLSDLYIGIKKSETHRQNISKSQKGIPRWTNEQRLEMSRTRTGRASPKKGTSQPFTGKYNRVSTPEGIFLSAREAAEFYKISESLVYARCSRNTKNWKLLKET